MAPPLQRIHPRLTTSALSFVRKPSGALGVWDQAPAMFIGSAARYAGPDQGTAQQSQTPTFAAVPNGTTQTCLAMQFLSDPLREQTIAGGAWRLGFAIRLANAGINFTWQGRAALLVVNGYTGERRGTIFDTTDFGSNARTVTTERTCLDTATGAAVDVLTGDYLCLEIGMAVSNAAADLVPQITIYGDGITPITSDDAAATNALSVLESPNELALSLPTTGEPSDASVTFAQATRLVKDHFPPYSGVLYDWDSSDATIKQVFDWFGDAIKLYGYDQVDRVFREVSPLTCVELLPAWESLLGVSQSRAAQRQKTIAQRRNLVLARLRERGPLTVFNLAAIFAILAEYVAGTRPEVIELDQADIFASNVWAETFTTPLAVPIAADFDATNIVRRSPALLDGGYVSEAGARVSLGFSSSVTSGVRVRLMAPDFSVADWGDPTSYPLPDLLSSTRILRSNAHVGKAVQGAWTLYVRRVAGSTAVNLVNWSLLSMGKGRGGRAEQKFNVAVFLDQAHQLIDRRDVEATLNRITFAYSRIFAVYSKHAIPGEQINGIDIHRAGRFLPGAP